MPGSRRSPVILISIVFAFVVNLMMFIKYSMPIKAWLVLMFFHGFFLKALSNLVLLTVSADLGRSYSK